MRMRRQPLWAGLAFSLGVALVAPSLAAAPPVGAAAVQPGARAQGVAGASRFGPGGLRGRQAFAERVAAALDGKVTPARVLAAIDAVGSEHAPTPDAWLSAMARHLGVEPHVLMAAIASAHAGMHPGMHLRRRLIETSAAYLGLAPGAMVAQLHQGRSLADLARATHKPVAGLEAAILDAIRPDVHRMVMNPWAVHRPPAAPSTPV